MTRSKSSDMSAMGRAWAIGMDLVIFLIAGGLIGYGLDWLFGTFPIFMILMGAMGLASGLLRFVREALQLNREMSRSIADLPPLEVEDKEIDE